MVRVIQSIYVNGHSHAMFGHFVSMGNEPKIETRGVVVPHCPFIISIPIIHKTHALDGVARNVKFVKDC